MSEQNLDTGDPRLHAAACSVVELTDGVFVELARLARVVAELEVPGRPALGSPRYWDDVERAVSAVLRTQPMMTGAGLAVWPAAVRSRPAAPSFGWWVLRDGEVRRKQHVLNPRSDSFYEVTEARWFRVPHRTGRPTLLPPYVDSWGTDDVTMTAAIPLILGNDILGVVAADLDVRVYLAALEQILAAAGATAVLDDDGRVIASTRPEVEPGVRLAAAGLGGLTSRAEIDRFGWTVVRS